MWFVHHDFSIEFNVIFKREHLKETDIEINT